MDYIILTLLLTNLAIVLYLFLKIKKIHLFCWDLSDKISVGIAQSVRNVEALDYLYRKFNFSEPLPPTMGFAGSPDFLRLIADYALNDNVEKILECSSGISTIVIAQAFKTKGKGHVYSLENDAKYADITRNTLKKYGLEEWATVITAPLVEMKLSGDQYAWYDFSDKIPDVTFDGLVIDGPPWSVSKNARYPAGPHLFPKLRAQGHIFLDDYIREEEQAAVEIWLSENPGMSLIKHPFMKGCAELIKGP